MAGNSLFAMKIQSLKDLTFVRVAQYIDKQILDVKTLEVIPNELSYDISLNLLNFQRKKEITPLIYWTQENKIDLVKKIIQFDAQSINRRTSDKLSAFDYAVINRDYKIADLLIEFGAEIEDSNKNNQYPLILYLLNYLPNEDRIKIEDLLEKIQYLYEKGASIKRFNKYGNDALRYAIQQKICDVAEFLINKEVDIHIPNHGGYTPLMLAAGSGVLPIIKILIEKGAEINKRMNNTKSYTALMIAIKNGWLECVKELLNYDADATLLDNQGNSPIVLAAKKGRYDIVAYFLEQDHDPNLTNNNADTGLMYASQKNYHRIVELLLKNNADVSKRNNQGKTAFLLAIDNGSYESAECLIEYGADVNECDALGNTPLTIAVFNAKIPIVNLLIEAKANINEQDSEGYTALEYARENGLSAIEQILLKAGAQANIEDYEDSE